MPTLANFHGGSLVPDLNRLFDTLGEIGEIAGARKAQTDLENDLRIAMGMQPVDDGSSGPMSLLGQVEPRMAQVVEQLRAGDDPIAQTQFRDRVSSEVGLAKELRKLPTIEARQRRLSQEASKRAAQGEDVSRIAQLSQMSEDQLNLELQKMEVVGNSALRAVPEVAQADIFRVLSDPARRDATVRILASNPRLGSMLLARRDQEIAKEEAARKAAIAERQRAAAAAAEARAPKTELGKNLAAIQADITNGNIQPEIGQQMMQQLRSDAIAQAPPEFKTDLGKAINDQQLAVDAYGANSPQAQAFGELVEGFSEGEAPDPSDVAGLRKEHAKASATTVEVKSAYDKIQAAHQISTEGDSGAGDISLLVGYMKMLDPGSVVREGEFATAENSGGVPQRIRGTYNSLVNGERLAQSQRDDFLENAQAIWGIQQRNQMSIDDQYRAIAERQKMNPENVVLDYIGTAPTPPPAPEEPSAAPPQRGGRVRQGQDFPEGTIIRNPETGERRILNEGKWITVDG